MHNASRTPCTRRDPRRLPIEGHDSSVLPEARPNKYATHGTDRDYSDDETEFMRAVDNYKRQNSRPFPTLCEVLGVVKALGYTRPVGYCSILPIADAPAIAAAVPRLRAHQLTRDLVLSVRRDFAAGTPQHKLGTKYGLTHVLTWRIVRRKIWDDV